MMDQWKMKIGMQKA
jgi:hypothetical protein